MTITNVNPDIEESMPTVEDYLRQDHRTPEVLFERSLPTLASTQIPKSRYTSREWHDLEVEHVWRKAWQMACRENDIPKVGDYIEYTIADQSIMVVRTHSGIKAFHNSCLHRGTALVVGSGTRENGTFDCPFHGWSWHIDGSINKVTCAWDFPSRDEHDYNLRDIRTDTWNGFVFVNFDPGCAPLADFIGPTLRRHFQLWPGERKWKALHVFKKINCNWKVGLEAFIEDYHVFRTHPQIAPYAGDCNSQYDTYDDLHHRMITAMGVPSPHVYDHYDDQGVVEAMIITESQYAGARSADDVEIPELRPGQTTRTVLADWVRRGIKDRGGLDLSDKSDPEILDAIEYHLYPNLIPWGGFSYPLTYRWRPAGNDPDWCYFDIMMTVPMPEGAELPRDVPPTELDPEAPWTDCAELAGLGRVYDQDMANLPRVQRGLHTSTPDTVLFARSQEANIVHFHNTLEKWISR